MAYVRYCQRLRLARRPGRYTLYDKGGTPKCHRIGKLRLPLLKNRGWKDVRQANMQDTERY